MANSSINKTSNHIKTNKCKMTLNLVISIWTKCHTQIKIINKIIKMNISKIISINLDKFNYKIKIKERNSKIIQKYKNKYKDYKKERWIIKIGCWLVKLKLKKDQLIV
jgi:hypothetical protein